MQKYDTLIKKCSNLKLISCLGSGNPKSKLWIVGEAPGQEEEKARMPFVGKSGRFLNAVLPVAGVKRENCFVTNVSPVRPPEDIAERLSETGITWEECFEGIQDLVKFWKPNVVLGLGNIALQALAGKLGITEHRGIVYPFTMVSEPVKVLCSFHPAYILRLGDKPSKKEREGEGGVKYTYGSGRITLILDIKKAKRESETRGLEIPERQLIWEDDYALEFLQGLALQRHRCIAFDIENKGSWIDRIAFALDEGPSISIALDQGPSKEEIKTNVRQLLRDSYLLVAQNGTYDMGKLVKIGMPVGRLYADTMLAHHVLYPELPHDLGYLASIYCNLDGILHPKGWNEDDKRGRYNALHASVTAEIWQKLALELEELNLMAFFREYQMPLFHILFGMGNRGVNINKEALEEVRAEVAKKYTMTKEKWNLLTKKEELNEHN
jgi:DNA polymerase